MNPGTRAPYREQRPGLGRLLRGRHRPRRHQHDVRVERGDDRRRRRDCQLGHADQLHLREQRGSRSELRGVRRRALRRALDDCQHDIRRQHRQRQFGERELLVGHLEQRRSRPAVAHGQHRHPVRPGHHLRRRDARPPRRQRRDHADGRARRGGVDPPDGGRAARPTIRRGGRGPILVRSAPSKLTDPRGRRTRNPPCPSNSSSTSIALRPQGEDRPLREGHPLRARLRRAAHAARDRRRLRRGFAAASPRLEVPCIVDGDFRCFDSTIIVDYLDEKWPESSDAPCERPRRVRARGWSRSCAIQPSRPSTGE